MSKYIEPSIYYENFGHFYVIIHVKFYIDLLFVFYNIFSIYFKNLIFSLFNPKTVKSSLKCSNIVNMFNIYGKIELFYL